MNSIIQELSLIFSTGFFQRAFIGGTCIALIAPLMGQYLVSRRASHLGDGISHVALLGVISAPLIGIAPLWGSFIAAALAGIVLEWFRMKKYLQSDAGIVILLVGSLAGVSILSSLGVLNRSLESLLFGSILTLSWNEISSIAVLTSIVLAITLFKYRDFLVVLYQDQLSYLSGVKPFWNNMLLMILISGVISFSIDVVGALLVSGLMIIPVVTTQIFQYGFRTSHMLSVVFAIVAVWLGLISSWFLNLPPSAIITFVLIGIYLIALTSRSLLHKISFYKN